jgi:flagellar FliL protein
MDPPFVVNFDGEQLVRFLQITVQVMTRDPATVEVLKVNDPVVRNDLLLLFANQKYEVVATRAGKEKLRSDALAAIRHVVENGGGKADHVEQVYFTSFVMQ